MANEGDNQSVRHPPQKPVTVSADALDDEYHASGSEREYEDAATREPLVNSEDSYDEASDEDAAVLRRAKRKLPNLTEEGTKDKKRKKAQTNRKHGKKDACIDFSTASPDDLAACLKPLVRTRTGLSTFEVDELGFGADFFQDTRSFKEFRGLAGLSSFVEFCMGGDAERLKKPPKQKKAGRPVVLVVCASAIRAANVVKSLDEFRKGCTVAKLFAKHIKIEDQVRFLESTPVNVAVGNPNRLCKLLDMAALQTDRLLKIIVDSSHKDPRGLSVWDLHEIQKDLMDLLTKHFAGRLKEGSAKIVCF